MVVTDILFVLSTLSAFVFFPSHKPDYKMIRKIVAPLLAVFCVFAIFTSSYLYFGREYLTWPSTSYDPISIGHNEAQSSINSTSFKTEAKTTSAEVQSANSSVPAPTPTVLNGLLQFLAIEKTVLITHRHYPFSGAHLSLHLSYSRSNRYYATKIGMPCS